MTKIIFNRRYFVNTGYSIDIDIKILCSDYRRERIKKFHNIYLLVFTAMAFSSLIYIHAEEKNSPPVYGYKVVNAYPHDEKAFTQGLFFEDGLLYESTGIRGKSTIRKVEIETGRVLESQDLPPRYFGEGITAYRDKIIQLTWQLRTGFVYDRRTLKPLRKFRYDSEGWGIVYDGRNLIMSDGSSVLRFMNPKTFKVIGELQVYDKNGPVRGLNELEFIDGQIWANVWGSDKIARINPTTGGVKSWIDLSGILPKSERKGPEDVLNGIAYDKETKRLFVTGKFWPKLFEIEITQAE